MKVLNRKNFLKMPEGTFFAKGVKWSINGFCIKGETTNGNPPDFYYHNLVDFEWEARVEHSDTFEKMLDTGESRNINKNYLRDGCFCDEDLFLIFEKPDLDYLKSLISLI